MPLVPVAVISIVSELPVVFWFNVGNVQLAKLPEVGVPSTGVTSVGLVANTNEPDPVSSDITLANSDDVVAAKADILSAS